MPYITVGDRGRRCGESHGKSKISDALVKELRDEHEMHGVGWRTLARLYGLRPGTVRDILTYARRYVLAPTRVESNRRLR